MISSTIMTVMLVPAVFVLPSTANITFAGTTYVVTPFILYMCVILGLWTGLIIGYVTEYYTSNKYKPV